MIKAAAPNKTNLNTNECPQQRSELKKERTSGISCGNEIDIYELFIPAEHQINVMSLHKRTRTHRNNVSDKIADWVSTQHLFTQVPYL